MRINAIYALKLATTRDIFQNINMFSLLTGIDILTTILYLYSFFIILKVTCNSILSYISKKYKP